MDSNSLVKRRRCLTREEEAEILMKKASGKFTDKELAEQHGVCRETILRVKKRWSPTVQAAQVYALSKALEVQKQRIDSISTYDDATDFLERLDVVQPKAERARNQGNQVQIVVGKIAGYDDDPEEMAIIQEHIKRVEAESAGKPK